MDARTWLVGGLYRVNTTFKGSEKKKAYQSHLEYLNGKVEVLDPRWEQTRAGWPPFAP